MDEGLSLVWPLVVIAIVGVALIALLANGRKLFRGTRDVHEKFRCPFRRQDVEVGMELTAWDGRRVDVHDCSAFTPPTAVTCDKACLALRNYKIA